MERSTGFRKQSSSDRETADHDSCPLETDTERPEARMRPPLAVQEGPHSDPTGFALGAADTLAVWNEHIAHFKPNWRQLAKNLVVGSGSPSDIRSAYNVVRTEALKRLRQHRWNTVAVTSPSRGSGNTVTALNLAISMARDLGQSVLLVELDLIHPTLHRILGFGRRQGVSDYLLHDAPLSEILLDIGIERFALIPAGTPVANSSELLSSPRMAQLVEEFKRCDGRVIVLFDLPSVLAVDDAMAFASLVDCALLVVEESETPVDDVRRALTRLQPTSILGIVLNRSIRREARGG